MSGLVVFSDAVSGGPCSFSNSLSDDERIGSSK